VFDDVLWIVLPLGACIGMLWLAFRIEPHWAARDGTRFLTTSQLIDGHGRELGRRREIRIAVAPDGRILASRRSLMRTNSETFALAGKSPDPPRGKEIYLLDSLPPDAGGNRLVLRLPRRSRAVPVLDAVLGASPQRSRKDEIGSDS